MTGADFEDLKSDKALVAHRQVNSEVGGTTIFCVVLADGFIIECGSDGYSQRRAQCLAEAVNAYGPFSFTRTALSKRHEAL